MDLAQIADELYALPADEFTKARNARAKQLRADDRDLADKVGDLKRPSASAWVVNQLVRRSADRVAELLELGEQLRDAQDALAGDELRRLNRERHQLVHAVAELARDLGPKVTDATEREVEATFDAALSDPAASDAVRTGRLVRALAAGGFEGVDLTDAVAVPDARPAPARRTPSRRKAARTDDRQQRERDKQRAAEHRRELARARTEAQRLEREVATHDRAVDTARQHVDAARERIESLEAELRAARSERTTAEKELDRAQRERAATAKEHRRAEQALAKLGD